MTIAAFMIDNATDIRDRVLPELDNRFNSHQFIQKFTQKYQDAYVLALYERRAIDSEEIFREVHKVIITTIRDNGGAFGLRRLGEEKDPEGRNIFGVKGPIQLWIKE